MSENCPVCGNPVNPGDALCPSCGFKLLGSTQRFAPVTLGDEAIAANPDEVARYRDGNTKVIGFFVGQCMKAMRGQGNPKIINELLAKKLAE